MAKYYNKKLNTPDGVFDSKAELERWFELKLLEKKGEVFGLQRQVEYELLPARKVTRRIQLKTKVKVEERVDERAITYKADFVYKTQQHGYVEDVKSAYTRTLHDYSMVRRLMKHKLDEMNKDVQLVDSEGRRIEDYWQFVEKVS